MTELKLYGPFETAADLPVGTWFIPADKTDVPCMAYRGSGHVDLLYAEGFPAHRHRGDLGEVRVAAVVGMPSQSGVPMCTLPLAEWLEWAWVRFDGITGEACLNHLKEEVQELDEAAAAFRRAQVQAQAIGDSSVSEARDRAYEEMGAEAADVIALALHTGLRLLGSDLPTAMHRKLAVNRGRDWSPRADGSLRHVEPEPECGCDHCENGNGCEAQREAVSRHHLASLLESVTESVEQAYSAFGLPASAAPITEKLERIVGTMKAERLRASDSIKAIDKACVTLGIRAEGLPAEVKLERIVRAVQAERTQAAGRAHFGREWREAGKGFAIKMLKSLGMDDGSGMPLNEDFGPKDLVRLADDCAKTARSLSLDATSARDDKLELKAQVRRLRRENGKLKSAQGVLRQAATAMDKILFALREDGEEPQTMSEWLDRFTAAPGASLGDRLTPDQHAERIIEKVTNAENDAKAFAHTVAWAAGQLGLPMPDDLAPDAKLEQIVDVLKEQAAVGKDVAQQYADLKLRLTTCLGLDAGEALETIVAHAEGHADWAKAMQRVVEATGVACWRQDPSVYADRIIARLEEGDARAERAAKAYADIRGEADNAEQRSRTLATIEGLLGCGKDEAIKTPVEAQQRLRHHIGDAVLASLASAVGADEQTLTSIDAAIARLMKYGRYRAECGQPIMPGHVVATGAGDSMLVGRVFLVDAEGKETSMLTSDLTWAASGMVLTGFGGARTVTVSGPLTFLGWR